MAESDSSNRNGQETNESSTSGESTHRFLKPHETDEVQPDLPAAPEPDVEVVSETDDDEIHEVSKRKDDKYTIGIIGATSSGKTAYLYTLGLLKVKGVPLYGWHIGGFSEDYGTFFGRVDTEERKRDWQLTKFDQIDTFNLFPIEKGRITINIRAFDAAGENFVRAIVPGRMDMENIPENKRQPIFDLKTEIVSCNALIFLIDAELSNPQYEQELKDESPRAILPYQLLLHLSNLLRNELDIRPSQRISTPIALVLTKADTISNNDDFPLTYFNEIKNSGGSIDSRDGDRYEDSVLSLKGESEVIEFLKYHFSDLYNLASTEYENKTYHAISCWGHEPKYYYEKEGTNEINEVLREDLRELRQREIQIKVWVEDIQPVCVQEPLLSVLERTREKLNFEKSRRLKRIVTILSAVLIALISYPLLSLFAGLLLETHSDTSYSEKAYYISEKHPFFEIPFMKQILIDRYLKIANKYFEENSLDFSYGRMEKSHQKLVELDSEIEKAEKLKDIAANLWMKISRAYLENRKYDRVEKCLNYVMQYNLKGDEIKGMRALAVIDFSKSCADEGKWRQATDTILPLFNRVIYSNSINEELKQEIIHHTSFCLNSMNTFSLKSKDYQIAIKYLDISYQYQELLSLDERKIKEQLFISHYNLGKFRITENRIDEGTDSLLRSLNWVESENSKDIERVIKTIMEQRKIIEPDKIIRILGEVNRINNLSISVKEHILDSMIYVVKDMFKNRDEANGLKSLKKIRTEFPRDLTDYKIEECLHTVVGYVPERMDKLALLENARKILGEYANLRKIESTITFEIAEEELYRDRPDAVIKLLENRPWIKEYQQFKEYKSKAMVLMAGIAFKENREYDGFSQLRKAINEFPGNETKIKVTNCLVQNLKRLDTLNQLKFIDETRNALGEYSELKKIEESLVFNIAKERFEKNQPEEVIELLKSRPWLKGNSEFDRYLMNSMAFVAKKAFYMNNWDVGTKALKEILHGFQINKARELVSDCIFEVSSRMDKRNRLDFLEYARNMLGDFPRLINIETDLIYEIVRENLLDGKPSKTIELLKKRKSLSSEKNHKKYLKHAQIAETMVFIPGGNGVEPFYIDQYEATNKKYEAIMRNDLELKPQKWGSEIYARYSPKADCPVIFVSWHQAKVYAKRIGKRLPTMREWERAWGPTKYPWGNEFTIDNCNTRESRTMSALPISAQVVQKDRSTYNVFGLAGNVAEYTSNTMNDDNGRLRAIVKGGCYIYSGRDINKRNVRKIIANVKLSDVGFRCAINAIPY